MELRHLRYFVAVAGEENVSRAALKLHVSQPALSRQIRDLEGELGFQLLERSAKSVRLTGAGKIFQSEATAILHRVEEAVTTARFAANGGEGDLHIGYAPSPTARLLPRTLRAFQSDAPSVRVLLHDLSTEEMLDQLRDGTLQVALLVQPKKSMLRGLRFEELARDTLCLAVAPKHRLASRRSVGLAEISREPLIAYSRKEYPEYFESIVQLFAAIRRKPRIAEEHDGVSSLVAAVESGAGVAVVADSVGCLAGKRLKFILIRPAPRLCRIGVAWSPKGLCGTAELFLKHARATALKA